MGQEVRAIFGRLARAVLAESLPLVPIGIGESALDLIRSHSGAEEEAVGKGRSNTGDEGVHGGNTGIDRSGIVVAARG